MRRSRNIAALSRRLRPSSYIIPTFTGSSAVFGDETQGYIELFSTGTLTIQTPGPYDLFAVGGGAGGGNGYYSDDFEAFGGHGGASGFTATRLSVPIQAGTYSVLIGSGGISASDGSTTSLDTFLSAHGGYALSATYPHGYGGSGGGGAGYDSSDPTVKYSGHLGGSDGSDGYNSTPTGENATDRSHIDPGGTGQHTTTRAFGQAGGTLYAGGGGGGGAMVKHSYYGSSGNGGSGGGGSGALVLGELSTPTMETPAAGTANTGGGGGGGCAFKIVGESGNDVTGKKNGASGGCGIAIVRWGF